MSENNTVARPYAKALFELAKEQNAFEPWTELLYGAACMVQDRAFFDLIKNPKFSDEEALRWMTEILKGVMNEDGGRFLELLASNKRLGVLPEILELYEGYRQGYQRTVDAFVASARPLGEEYKQRIRQALKARLGVENVELDCTVDETLLAGALIKAGDIVIDGSAKGRLSRLGEALGV